MYVLAGLWLAGFLAAGITAGAPGAVVCGSLGLLGFLSVAVARIDGEQPRTSRPPVSYDRTRIGG
jgi:hypothetical protein